MKIGSAIVIAACVLGAVALELRDKQGAELLLIIAFVIWLTSDD